MDKRYGHSIRILHWCIAQSMTHTLAQMDLTASQGHILGFLAHQKDAPCPRDVEQAFQLSHPTVSGILTRLEKKGFLQLRTDPQDRRCKRIYLLPKGDECIDRMHRLIQENEAKIVRDFTDEEQAQFAALLNRAMKNMGGHSCHSRSQEVIEK